ncbi:MAG: magnesium transporter [Erysipelotrichaceae bacterium]|nr:magnesium transporter [Erysipelotrichaceae bacterium]
MDTSIMITLQELKELIWHKKIGQLREVFEEYNIVDMSELVGELTLQEALFLFKTLKKDITSQIFAYLSHDKQEELIQAFTGPQIKEMLDALYDDDIIEFIEEMPANIVHHILQNASPQQRVEINQLLSYEENSAGSIMSTNFVVLKETDTVPVAFRKIKEQGSTAETIHYCYITDERKVLRGVVTLRNLLLSDQTEPVSEIMNTDLVYVKTTDDQEDVAKLFEKYDLTVIPVVNDDKCLIGIVTVDDIIDVIHEEATEDIHKMSAITPMDKTYLDTSVLEMAKSRILWLLILMISATFTGQIMANYEAMLQANVALSIFIPMLMDAAGNAGNQASTMVIRALATGELKTSDMMKIWWKEIRIALLCGMIMGGVNFLRILLFMGTVDMKTSLIVSLTVFVTVGMAKLVGCTLPVIAQKLKFDPAVMAGPLITTVVDALSLFVYFQLATRFLL